jgi:hypothetical protein
VSHLLTLDMDSFTAFCLHFIFVHCLKKTRGHGRRTECCTTTENSAEYGITEFGLEVDFVNYTRGYVFKQKMVLLQCPIFQVSRHTDVILSKFDSNDMHGQPLHERGDTCHAPNTCNRKRGPQMRYQLMGVRPIGL